MADEIKKIIEIDTGDSITSLKEYKKHIDDLRGSLLALDKTSEEYAKVSDEIRQEQTKLNEVMKVGKDYSDAADGSYNKLVQTMSELKKQWRATSDEAERAQLGSQILDINNQLKELDASTGNFQRNVGDYSNAFQEAFKASLDGIQSLDGPLGDVAGQTKKLLPLIKSVNSTALTGLSGIKKGIASTGIGGIIILISQLITHWKEFTEFIGISQEEIDKFKEKSLNTFKNIVAGAVGVGNVLLQYLLTPIRTIAQGFIGLGNIIRDIFTGDFAKVKDDAVAAFGSIKDAFTKGFDIKENFNVGKQVGEQFIAGIEDRIASSKKKTEEIGHSVGSSLADGIKESEPEVQQNLDEILKAELEAIKEQLKEYNDALKKLNKESKQELFEADIEAENEQEKAEKIYEINRKLIEDKIALQQEYVDSFLGDIDKQLEAEETLAELRQELANLDKKRAKDVQEYETKQAQIAAKNKKAAYEASVASIGTLFGSLSDMFEEGSEQQKAFAIMEATINTIAGAIGAFMKASETYPAPYGQIIGAATAAAVTLSGVAQINKIKSTTKNSSGNVGSMEAPNVNTNVNRGAIVNPLLNEESDLARLNSIPVTQESETTKPQNIKVYVTESDISDATHKAEVRDNNSTF